MQQICSSLCGKLKCLFLLLKLRFLVNLPVGQYSNTDSRELYPRINCARSEEHQPVCGPKACYDSKVALIIDIDLSGTRSLLVNKADFLVTCGESF
jgi:hypothetical protein